MTGETVLAVDLGWCAWPEWMASTLAYRFGPLAALDGAGATRRYSWRVYYRAAVDHSELPLVPRSVLRVLIDRTTDGRDGAPPPITVPDITARDIAVRTPCHPDHANRALHELAAAGWLGIVPRPGRVPVLTLLAPCDTPAPRAGVTPAPRAAPPAPRAGVPRATRGTLETGDTETSGDAPLSISDAVPRGVLTGRYGGPLDGGR